ncbi:conserved hypothetical protein [Formosa agariphila KMM 3901]|uniref:Uncharacterized protein n=1 Tax=Formosa agariphila (strain DSM 15362 / KCTC 12365 / LMG 23005 / KMM 3901 / M-2Alg 35-1) TaxID=1347342 RepID=T2KJL6_FORAG|nr:hypothetical protein [Formosa agariphila]CDF78623.1 conserved hypothetical protein [Formosa agariphila KMM 3901]
MKTITRNLLTALVVCVLSIQFVSAQRNIRPPVHNNNYNNSSKPIGWVNLGTTHAKHTADHDRINVPGPFDYYRKIKFKVRDAPVNIQRMVVTYDNGAPEKIDTRFDIPKNGESRVIDLRGGKRKLRSIEFWYDTKGILNGTADVTVYGLK